MGERVAPAERSLTDVERDRVRQAYGALRENMPGFTPRRVQAHMVADATRALATTAGIAVIEAPTGTGKSLGYLSAAVPMAQQLNRKVLIATATVALQEQLVGRDIPAFLKATGTDARIAIAKGRQRYACVRNLHELAGGEQVPLGLPEEDLEPAWSRPPQAGESELVSQLSRALGDGSWDGDLDRSPAPVGDALRPLITTTAGGCTGGRCAFQDSCPFLRARRALDEADIIVANHALVLADLMLDADDAAEDAGANATDIGGVILPPLSETVLVVDEAHRLSDNAIEAGASTLHVPSALKRMTRWPKLLRTAYGMSNAQHLAGVGKEQAVHALGEYSGAIDALVRVLEAEWTPDPDDREPQWRAPGGVLPPQWVAMAAEIRVLCARIGKVVAAALNESRQGLKEAGGRHTGLERLVRQLGMAREQLRAQYLLWQRWGVPDVQGRPPTARWLTLGTDLGVICHASPITAAPLLEATLWRAADGAVLTSATLSAGGDFTPLAKELGAPPQAEFVALPSPFDLAAQATLEVPFLPSTPDQFDAHVADCAGWLITNLDWDAGSLILFTSRRKMEAVFAALPAPLQSKVRRQGSQPREQLLGAHAAAIAAGQGSALLGLASFGEGLDLPGALATTVVVTQLPFAVPTEPVAATASEWITARGGNPFLEMTIPQTIRTLTQYCGRLVRGPTDRGRIVLLDRRVVAKRYGREILASLPPFTQRIERTQPRPEA